MIWTQLTSIAMVFTMAQVDKRFNGLKEFKSNFDYSIIQIVVTLLIVPIVAIAILIVIRKLQDSNQEKVGFSEVVEGLHLTEAEVGLIETIARRANLPAPARIIQSHACFSESVNSYVCKAIETGRDPRDRVREIDQIRDKLGFREASASRPPLGTEELDFPARAMAQLDQGKKDGGEEIEVLLLATDDEDIRIVAFDKGLEGQSGIIQENERVRVDFPFNTGIYSFSAVIKARNEKDDTTELVVGHTHDISFVRKGPGRPAVAPKKIDVSVAGGETVTAGIDLLDADVAHVVLPGKATPGENAELTFEWTEATARGKVRSSTSLGEGAYRTVIGLREKSAGFPTSLTKVPDAPSEDHPVAS